MAYGYWFWYEQGAMLEKDYPYVGSDQKCDHNASKTIGKTGDWGNLKSITDTKAKLATQPLTIAMDASQNVF